jgi:hypothetical protein
MTAVAQTRETAAPQTYRFGTGAPAGVWLGLGLPRIVILAAGLLVSVGLLAMRSGLPLSLCPLIVAAAVTLLPVAGRPLAGWVTPATVHGQGAVAGRSRWTAPVPHTPLTGTVGLPSGARLQLPPECGRVRLLDAPAEGSGWPVGMLRAPRSAAATLLFEVAGPDRFGLLDADGQDRLIGGWGRALAGFAQRDRGLSRVQLLERVTADESDLHAATTWATDRGERARSELAALASLIDATTVRRDSLIAVEVAGVRDGSDVIARARDIAGQLLAAELVARPLAATEIASAFRRMLNPGDMTVTGDVGPVSRRTGWDHVRTDESWHRSYAVVAWPGSPVPANWLSSLLVATPGAGTWTVAVHLAAVAPEVATRLARAARAKAELDRADRARLGMPASAAADKAVIESAGMDAELVAGHATHRLAAVLTCTASSRNALAECARGLRDAASGAGLTVRPLHGQHHLALAATLPLCRLRHGGVA